jgi:hypothetical protein
MEANGSDQLLTKLSGLVGCDCYMGKLRRVNGVSVLALRAEPVSSSCGLDWTVMGTCSSESGWLHRSHGRFSVCSALEDHVQICGDLYLMITPPLRDTSHTAFPHSCSLLTRKIAVGILLRVRGLLDPSCSNGVCQTHFG